MQACRMLSAARSMLWVFFMFLAVLRTWKQLVLYNAGYFFIAQESKQHIAHAWWKGQVRWCWFPFCRGCLALLTVLRKIDGSGWSCPFSRRGLRAHLAIGLGLQEYELEHTETYEKDKENQSVDLVLQKILYYLEHIEGVGYQTASEPHLFCYYYLGPLSTKELDILVLQW